MATGEAIEGGAQRTPPAHKISYEEFLEWCDEDTLAEWVRGWVRVTSPAARRHQDLGGFLYVLVSFWVERHDLGMVLQPPFQMKLPPPTNTGREPDLLFIRREHLDRLRETYLDGPADLVVEITSPESLGRDRGEKFVEYEQGGVPEYWFIDRDRRQAEFYELGPDGRYRIVLSGSVGEYRSPILEGFRLPLEWLWQDPLPRKAAALRELGLLT